MQTFRMIDFETTGFPPGAGVVEIGWCDVAIGSDGPEIKTPFSTLVNPFRANPDLRMSPAAMAVHQITPDDLVDAPSVDEGFRMAMDGADVFVAHNAEFERQFFTGGDRPWVCTLRASRRAWPDEASHSLQNLRFSRALPVADREYARAAHRAGPDAYVTAFLFVALLEAGLAVEDMVGNTSGPALLARMPFGKHRGKTFDEIPLDYLAWLKNSTTDRDVMFTVKNEMKRRNGKGGPGRGLVSSQPVGGF